MFVVCFLKQRVCGVWGVWRLQGKRVMCRYALTTENFSPCFCSSKYILALILYQWRNCFLIVNSTHKDVIYICHFYQPWSHLVSNLCNLGPSCHGQVHNSKNLKSLYDHIGIKRKLTSIWDVFSIWVSTKQGGRLINLQLYPWAKAIRTSRSWFSSLGWIGHQSPMVVWCLLRSH